MADGQRHRHIINSKGQATIVGEIAPPKEFLLFPEKDYSKRLIKVEIRAGYGIPVVGEVGVFANISLDAIAKVGPGKLYKIKLSGTYSTDPRVPKQLSIEGTINISAFAGLRARAEAGLLVTIIAHDIKAGVGLFAFAGVRGYVEATPRIGMREPRPGKRDYFIQGHLEIAAQPVLGFGGDLFVAIETPWWSPLSDKRWTWPLYSLEYPLPGEFGIGADVDYVLGSKQWPTIAFGEVNFDSSKFLTDVMNDNTDTGKGGEVKKPGEWKEGSGGDGPGGAKNKGGSGKKPGELVADNESVGESEAFSDGHEAHRLWFAEKPGEAKLMVASEQQSLPERLAALKGQVNYLLKKDRAGAERLIGKIQAMLPKVQDEAQQVAVMKLAESKAKETYQKYGNDKGKKKGNKASRKDKNKQLKADEKILCSMLKDLFVLMRRENWKNIKKPATWNASLRSKSIKGNNLLEIVAGEKSPKSQIVGGDMLVKLTALEKAPLGKAANPAGRQRVAAAKAKLASDIKQIEEVPVVGNKVQALAYIEIEQIAGHMAAEISTLGQNLKISTLLDALKISKMEPAWEVEFTVNRNKNRTYEETFHTEMKRQLAGQQTALNQLTVDTWVVRIDTYKSKMRDIFDKLDDNARKAVATEIRKKLDEIKPPLNNEVALLTIAKENLQKFLDKPGIKETEYKNLTKAQKKHYKMLERLAKEAEEIAPSQAALKAFLKQHGDLGKLKPEEREQFITLSKKAKLVGRSGQEAEFRGLHEEGIKEVEAVFVNSKAWENLYKWGGSTYALLHNPDQIAGGHGTIADFAPLKKPTLPAHPNEADQKQYDQDLAAWKKYAEELSKFVGHKWINSIIGGGWGAKIPSLKADITNDANYNAPLYGLWQINFKLTYQLTPPKK
jgi:hypothetical protein